MERDDTQRGRLLEALRAAEAGDLGVRLPPDAEDAGWDAVAHAFNGLMQRAFRLRGEALGHLGHELRTPLNAMLALSQLLAENEEGHLTPQQVEYARTILSSGRELLGLLEELLEVAKADAGKLRLEPREVGMAELLAPLERAFRPMAQRKGLGFHLEVRPDTPPHLRTDPRRVSQVLRNLLSNALKFTPTGQVRLAVGPARGGRVAFAVADTGVGIPHERRHLVFEAFQQGDGGLHYGGTGLGLTISRELAHRLGGELLLESEPGRGSTFTLLLPHKPACLEVDVAGGPTLQATSGEQPGTE